MYTLYGFVGIPNFRNNQAGKTATIGELTTFAETFSTERGEYSLQTYPNVYLTSIDSRRDGALVEVGLAYYDVLLHLSQWLYDRTLQGAVGTDPLALKQALNTEFSNSVNVTTVGAIIQKDSYYFPSYLELTVTNAGEENTLFLWYANDLFVQTYPNYEMRVVLPVDNMDDLLGDRETVLATLKAITPVSHNNRLQKVLEGKPQSYIWTGTFGWHDKDNSDITTPATFSIAINGLAGNNIDLIKVKLREAILAGSAYGQDIWSKVFPEIFTATEFYIVPLWDRVSLPNQVQETGLYSPTVPALTDLSKYAEKYFKGYAQDFVTPNTCISASVYKSLQFLSCGNADNYNAQTRFDLQWPKYAAIRTDSPEFAKLPPDTQAFIMALVTLIQAAEVGTATSLIPSGMTRTERDGVYYFTTTVDGVQYLCPIKDGFAMADAA